MNKYIIMIQDVINNKLEIINTSDNRLELSIIQDNLNKFFFNTRQNNQFSVIIEELKDLQ